MNVGGVHKRRNVDYILLGTVLLSALWFAEKALIRFGTSEITRHAIAVLFLITLVCIWYGLSWGIGRFTKIHPSRIRHGLLFLYAPIFPLALFDRMRFASLGLSFLLFTPLLVSLVVYALKSKYSENSNRLNTTALFIFCIGLLVNLTPSVDRLVNSLTPALSKPSASYEEKMTMRWGEHYLFTTFLRDNTSEDYVVFVPPARVIYGEFGFWDAFVQSFVYPRQVRQGLDTTTCRDFSNVQEPTVLVAVSANNISWPLDLERHPVMWFRDAQLGIIFCQREVAP